MSEDILNQINGPGVRDYLMRRPCTACGCALGVIKRKAGQDVVRCQGCNRYQYCAPRSETGLPA
ncbi:hypothetical protein O7635_05310 [Asanoa sp. WMMD1127]|uniref:hypothetical protein n=1 Tax=Asanoa sp. WMMD1127 TaxID=3016107 RepID=UPI00241781CD|nr:hypothetical protein [Asanoa sp. WMMD1127]MDG4821270.1 hypothetical protein [Asanoa sp. WMMD1127]